MNSMRSHLSGPGLEARARADSFVMRTRAGSGCRRASRATTRQEGRHHAQEREDHDHRRWRAAPGGSHARVEVEREHEPRDERPRLLRVPLPVHAPRLVGPGRARHDAEGEHRKAEQDELVDRAVEPPDVLSLEAVVAMRAALPHEELQEIGDLHRERDDEHGVRGERDGDVPEEPGALERGEEGLDLGALAEERVEHRATADERHEETGQPHLPAPLDDEVGDHRRPREPREALVERLERRAIGDAGAERHDHRLERRGREERQGRRESEPADARGRDVQDVQERGKAVVRERGPEESVLHAQERSVTGDESLRVHGLPRATEVSAPPSSPPPASRGSRSRRRGSCRTPRARPSRWSMDRSRGPRGVRVSGL